MGRRPVLWLTAVLALTAVDTAAGAKVAAPRFVRNIATGETGWFSSPGLVDLDGDRRLEIVAPFYIDVYRVPRSRPNLRPWPTGRGNLLRDGTR
jgi:hypothetical protein